MSTETASPLPRLKMGMVGGGLESMAGRLHRHAMALDGGIDFVAGALASTPERADAAAKAFHVPRAYASWQQMPQAEAHLPKPERIDFVAIAELELDFPTVQDGLRGMAFIDAAVDSDAGSAKWTALAPYLA